MIKRIYYTELTPIRIDRFLTDYLEEYSRSKVQEMFKQKLVTVAGKVVKASYLLKEGDLISFTIKEEESKLTPVDLKIEIVYEDEDLIVLYKPHNLIVHPSESTTENTLVNHLLYYCDNLPSQGDVNRPGIVHRLDKETTGLLVVAKTDKAYNSLIEQFKNRQVKKLYEAICHNPFIEKSGVIDAPIKREKIKMVVDPTGKNAVTNFKVIAENSKYAHLEIDLITGRTHQIRTHLAFINHPLVGDCLYGRRKDAFKSFYLHAKYLAFTHPSTNLKQEFNYPLPKEFKEALKRIDLL